MGVRGLTGYMKRTRAAESVTFYPAREDETPKVIIFDALSVLGFLMKGEVSIFCDVQQLLINTQRYVDGFRRCGFELVAVLDGSVDEAKFPAWLERKKRSYDEVKSLNEVLGSDDQPRPFSWEIARQRPPMTISSSFYLGQAFQACGCETIWTTAEADQEVAYLCQTRNAFAVLTSDSDFHIFDVPRLIDSNTVRFGRGCLISCTMYSRQAVLREIGLPQADLFRLAALMGCDVTERTERLKDLHPAKVVPAAIQLILSSDSHGEYSDIYARARSFYTPCAPSSERISHPALIALLRGLYQRGVAVEDLSQTPGHILLAPLRVSVYANLGLKSVREYLCCMVPSADGKSTWSFQREVQADPTRDSDPQVPPPSQWAAGDLDVLVKGVVALVVRFAGACVTDGQRDALLGQYFDRAQFRDRRALTRFFPRTRDLHARNLFLQTWELVCYGADERPPNVWDVFDGPLFHFLCLKSG
eukprot:188382_1